MNVKGRVIKVTQQEKDTFILIQSEHGGVFNLNMGEVPPQFQPQVGFRIRIKKGKIYLRPSQKFTEICIGETK